MAEELSKGGLALFRIVSISIAIFVFMFFYSDSEAPWKLSLLTMVTDNFGNTLVNENGAIEPGKFSYWEWERRPDTKTAFLHVAFKSKSSKTFTVYSMSNDDFMHFKNNQEFQYGECVSEKNTTGFDCMKPLSKDQRKFVFVVWNSVDSLSDAFTAAQAAPFEMKVKALEF